MTCYPGNPTYYPGNPTYYPGNLAYYAGNPTYYPGDPSCYLRNPTCHPGKPMHYPGSLSYYLRNPAGYQGYLHILRSKRTNADSHRAGYSIKSGYFRNILMEFRKNRKEMEGMPLFYDSMRHKAAEIIGDK